MSLSRRTMLQRSAIVGAAAAAAPGLLAFSPAVTAASGSRRMLGDPPQTGFERTGSWTTHEDELALLDQVMAETSNPVRLTRIGTTAQGRPIHLVIIGLGADASQQPRTMPATMILGSQHGNEPAGREANLKLIRDLAYMDLADAANAREAAVLAEQTLLVVPSANPDGREANSRANSKGIDINRDHLSLVTEEARAFAEVILEWEPYLSLDLHEYGPTTPVRYDDDLLYLWPRNLNVDMQVHDKAKEFCFNYIKADGEAAGYSADEYGQQRIGPNVGPVNIGQTVGPSSQSAGGPDEGICRNAMGLRNSMGILVESATSAQRYRAEETLSSADLRRRRVDSQRVVLDAMLRFNEEQGADSKLICDGARVRKATEGAERSAPLYFDGADNEPSTDMADPPPSGYRLSPAQLADPAIQRAISGHGIVVEGDTVSMAQHAEPVIGLLLDGRGGRRITAAEPMD